MHVAVNQGPILSSTIIPPSSNVEDLEVPGWVKSSAKMLNGGIEGQDWLTLAKKLGESHFVDSLHWFHKKVSYRIQIARIRCVDNTSRACIVTP